jgi:hypothetical protein
MKAIDVERARRIINACTSTDRQAQHDRNLAKNTVLDLNTTSLAIACYEGNHSNGHSSNKEPNQEEMHFVNNLP